MIRLIREILLLALVFGCADRADAFSLLGRFKDGASLVGEPWQADGFHNRPQGLGYSLAGDIGGPMFPIEAYRWNVPVITYAFDLPFVQYFGEHGINAIEEAIAMLNALPPASEMTPSLTEFALDTKAENSEAAALGLLDIKSYALSTLLEEMGLANPERFVWGLRAREANAAAGFTNYTVINLNYDPVTLLPSTNVNGTLYNFQIFDALGPQGQEWASAVEWYVLDPLFQPYTSVAGGIGSADGQLGEGPSTAPNAFFGLNVGQYFTGLTRDDAGGLRFLYSPDHMVFDSLLPTVAGRSAFGGSPWAPFLGGTNVFGTNTPGVTNVVGTNANFTNITRTAFRGGVDKITFRRVNVFGTNFTPITLKYTDRFINPTNGRVVRQQAERLVQFPDILFTVRDLGTVDFVPFLLSRTSTSNWVDNAAINAFYNGNGLGGPGTIAPPMVIAFSDLLPYYLDFIERDPTETQPIPFGTWGSFDGSDTPPVVYPIGNPRTSLDYLRRNILRRPSN